jgi:hypothetical protein
MWKKNYWTCGVFNSLNIKIFVSLNVILLFLDTLICVLRAQVNLNHNLLVKLQDRVNHGETQTLMSVAFNEGDP